MKGLIFSEPMVKAWMIGRKTVTRRLMNPQPPRGVYNISENMWVTVEINGHSHGPYIPPYRPGETVYIKEMWADLRGMGFGNDPRTDKPFLAAYKADTRPGSDGDRARKDYGVKWKSPRFMPEWASRSHALIKSVRPERVQEITPEDVKKEGLIIQDFAPINVLALLGLTPKTYMEEIAIMEFQSLWESLHPGSWERNDWVWRIELEKH